MMETKFFVLLKKTGPLENMYKLTKEDCFDMPAANGKGYFEADNDWNEGQPLSVIAWMPKPEAYKE